MKEKDLCFSFEFVDKQKISKEINKLDEKKACQEHDIPVKLIKSNKDLFSHFICHNFNNSLFSSNFPQTIVQLVFFLRSLRSMKDVCMTKCINTLIKCFLNTNADFVKVIIHSIVYW